jgi:hypothetical protein
MIINIKIKLPIYPYSYTEVLLEGLLGLVNREIAGMKVNIIIVKMNFGIVKISLIKVFLIRT